MKKTIIRIFIIISTAFNLLVPTSVLGDVKKELAEVYLLYVEGDYRTSLAKLNKIEGRGEVKGMIHYWKGQVYFKTQKYNLAIKEYRQAYKNNVKPADIYYQLGQSLYASQKLEKSRTAFLLSLKHKFKKTASLYYAGSISLTLEEYKLSKRYFKKLVKMKSDPDGVKKPSMLQLAEIKYEESVKKIKGEKELNRAVEKNILPEFQKAADFNKKDPLTSRIKKRILTLQKKHKIDFVKRMINGRAIPKKLWKKDIKIVSKYDSNVISRADTADPTPSAKDSLVNEFSASSKYQFNFKRRFSIIPKLKVSTKYHHRRDEPEVYKNDSISYDPSLKNWWEHKLFNYKARMMVEIEYNHTSQDYKARKRYDLYSSHWLFIVGEKFKLLPIGESTFKLKIKDKKSYNYTQDVQTLTFNLLQMADLIDKYKASINLNSDFEKYADVQSDTSTYKITVALIIPDKFFKYYSIDPSYSFTYIDTKRKRGSKGYEKTYNPSIKIKRSWHKLDVNLSYSYTKKVSKAASTSSYTKHELGLELGYNF